MLGTISRRRGADIINLLEFGADIGAVGAFALDGSVGVSLRFAHVLRTKHRMSARAGSILAHVRLVEPDVVMRQSGSHDRRRARRARIIWSTRRKIGKSVRRQHARSGMGLDDVLEPGRDHREGGEDRGSGGADRVNVGTGTLPKGEP